MKRQAFLKHLTRQGCQMFREGEVLLSIYRIMIQEMRPIVKINAAVFICDAIVGIDL